MGDMTSPADRAYDGLMTAVRETVCRRSNNSAEVATMRIGADYYNGERHEGGGCACNVGYECGHGPAPERPDLDAIRARGDALKLGLREPVADDIAEVCERDLYHLLAYARRLEAQRDAARHWLREYRGVIGANAMRNGNDAEIDLIEAALGEDD